MRAGDKVFWWSEQVTIVSGPHDRGAEGIFWKVHREARGPCPLLPGGAAARDQLVNEETLTEEPDLRLTEVVADFLKEVGNE